MTLERQIRKMIRRRGDAYRPRTRHLDDKGQAIYTNRLFLESSPYLIQHAHNPVDWYPWGDEAFAAAGRMDRPVLLSVGYATCHWCHVMEEESFEDEEIAGYINANYIAVKVDREERPDVDAIYMSAVQAITGRGGWPMTVWLTPDREPFYGGTYFPARDGDRGSPVGFLTLLEKIRSSYDDKRELVDRSAGELSRAVRRMLAPAAGGRLPMAEVLERAVSSGKTRFDPVHGGIAGAPKFPSSLPIRLLLRHHRRTGDTQSLNMAALTLEKMAAGGMNDQVGGGFHRYSTDERWQVPHFEKMLYDNALLVPAYIEGWQATGNERFRQVAINTLDYVAREMTSPEGGFYSATDADSLTPSGHREEGWFFTWTAEELDGVLGSDDARIAAAVYGVAAGGNFEGRSVLFLPRVLDHLAADLGLSPVGLASAVERINAALYAHRLQRPAPLRDEKILAAWNGLMISAFARSGFALDDSDYLDRAGRAAEFILDRMVANGRLKRSFKDGLARGNGFLDDHAFVAAGLLDLFEATAELYWLTRAVELDRVLAEDFEDTENGGFFMTADDHEVLIVREKPALDGALPSGNAVALMNLLRLNALTLDPSYLKRAEQGFVAFSTVMAANPSAFGEMLLALDDFLHPPRQVIIVTPAGADARRFADGLRPVFLPGSPAMIVTESKAAQLSRRFPLFKEKRAAGGQTTAYVCQNGACQLPVSTGDALMQQLRAS
ncbi:thioredoxin domain-containing protein [Desulfosarcina alkanivorans]|uniref:Thioredoxin domain-containing protein n=1 Tax=Desulfosarcina alkanivorans TaxID=571177 RepID=A0A5K7YTB5_9BACT|nr:thioredoxin domain-containing protein [Desulfosarcina alkanivorans]BBO71229.1 thioredoxin domain-containing protein [Desulfosarcina alkanivorans]